MMRWTLITLTALAACAAPEPPAEKPQIIAASWSFAETESELRAASCLAGERPTQGETIEISAEPVSLGETDAVDDALSDLVFVGGWALESEHAGFGGLSGLAITDSGALLAVSDEAAFVWLSLQPGEDFTPEPTARFAYMRDANGNYLRGKTKGDAEGLALRDGLAFVSFERDHRVDVFDLGTCAAAARAVPVQTIGDAPLGLNKEIESNKGPEALAMAGDHLIIGLEEPTPDGAPVGQLGGPLAARIAQDGGQLLTGFDQVGDTLFSLHRAYFPGIGNTISVKAHQTSIVDGVPRLERSRTLATLGPRLSVDNFEGIAAQEQPDGALRLFLISDDNFSARQRTLLYAFDIPPAE